MYPKLTTARYLRRPFPIHAAILCAIVVAATNFLSTVNAQPQASDLSKKTSSGFAVLELFTSQGCNSCPSADENLAEIARQATLKGDKIVTLSFHVDYWNYLSWRDPYSTADATKRQRLYAGVHGSKQVYTPQLVVNGTTELLGSNRDKTKVAIQSAIKKRPRSSIQLMTKNEGSLIAVEWDIEGLQTNDLINVALVQNQVEDRVETGENSGRTLKHVNVVRDFHVINPATSKNSMSISMPDGLQAKECHIVAYLQSPMDASIHAVAVGEIASAN